ncbi:acyl-CoA dehydrogenase family protein [Streptomyces sp. NPDC004726]
MTTTATTTGSTPTVTTTVTAPQRDADHFGALDDAVAEIVHRHGAKAQEPEGRRRLWDALEQGGFTLLSIPEDSGGSGGGLAEAAVVVRRCAYAGVRLPLVGTLLGAWSCAWAGAEIPEGPLAFGWIQDGTDSTYGTDTAYSTNSTNSTYGPVNVGDAGRTAGPDSAHGTDGTEAPDRSGGPREQAVRLPWAPFADHLVLLDHPRLIVADRRSADVRERANDDVGGTFTGEPVGETTALAALPGVSSRYLPTAGQARLRAALLRSAELHGAAAAALDQAAGYSGEREQFGRALHRFQAVAHLLAQCAGEVVTTGVAVDAALAAADDRSAAPERAEAAAVVAKIQASATAGRIAAAAHQIHGAIGFTEEHPLHISTRALWQWRDDYGDEHHWAARLSALAERHGRGLWDLLAD